MKKRIFAMLLAALLVANISACNYIQKNETENGTETREESFESSDRVITNQPSITEPPNTDSFDYLKLKEGIYLSSSNENKYIYVEPWEAYYQFPYTADINISLTDIMLCGDTLSCLIHDFREHPDVDQFTIIKFTRGKNAPEINQSDDFSILQTRFSELPLVYSQILDENRAVCMFFECSTDHGSYELVSIYKTENSGKTWFKEESETVVSSSSQDEYLKIAKFVTPAVGIISYRCIWFDDICLDHTFLTSDGGKTWSIIRNLPFPCYSFSHADLDDLTYENETYILKLTLFGVEEEYGSSTHTIQFQSTNLTTWSLVK